MGKYVVSTVQVITRRYYVEVNDPEWACDSIVFEELDHFSSRHLSEDIVGVQPVEQFPAAEENESVNAATYSYDYDGDQWVQDVRWDLDYKEYETFTVDGRTYEVPKISIEGQHEGNPICVIKSGPFKGVKFVMSDMRMSSTVEDELLYELAIINSDAENPQEVVDQIKPIVDNFIISILYKQMKHEQNERESK